MNKDGQKKTLAKEQKTKTNANGNIPYGREAVKNAILDATEKLLLTKSPNKITVREIAAAANIKHPLIHRHFGTKDEVINAAHFRSIGNVEAVVAQIRDFEGNFGLLFHAVKNNRFRQIALTRAMLEGISMQDIPQQFPVMRHLLELLRKRQAESDSEFKFTPEMLAAFSAAATLGWFLYEPFLLAATGLQDKNQDELDQSFIEILDEILRKLC